MCLGLAVRDPVPGAGAAAAPSHAARARTAQPGLGDGPASRGEPAQPAAEGGLRRRRRARPDLARARRRRRARRPAGRAGGDLLPLIAAVSGYAIWQGERALRSRVADERRGSASPGGAGEQALRLAGRARRPDAGVAGAPALAYEHQKRWYAVCASRRGARAWISRAARSPAGPRCSPRPRANQLAAGGEITVLDLTEGRGRPGPDRLRPGLGLDPLVWVLPDDLPRLDLGTGLSRDALADLLAQVASVTDEQASARDLSLDTSVLGWVIDVLAENPQRQATVAAVTAGLRALAQAGDPRDDVAAGLLSAGQADRLTAMFGRAATERVVLERAWILEAQLRKLAPIGTALAPLPRSALRVIALDRRVGAVGSRVLGDLPHGRADPPAARHRAGAALAAHAVRARRGQAARRRRSTGSATRASGRRPGSCWPTGHPPARQAAARPGQRGGRLHAARRTPRRPRPRASRSAPSTASCSPSSPRRSAVS